MTADRILRALRVWEHKAYISCLRNGENNLPYAQISDSYTSHKRRFIQFLNGLIEEPNTHTLVINTSAGTFYIKFILVNNFQPFSDNMDEMFGFFCQVGCADNENDAQNILTRTDFK